MLGQLLRCFPFQLAVTCALLLALPAMVAAHGGASPSLVVTVDHVDPGTSVPVIAADFGSDSRVVFEMVSPARSTELGNAVAGADGHFSASFQVPADYPHGWADLVATGDDGSSTSAQVLVGPIAGAPARPNRILPWWQDASIWLLGAFVIGAVFAGSWALFRSRRQPVHTRRRSGGGRR